MKKLFLRAKRILKSKEGLGMSEVIGTAAVIIIAAFVLIPGLREFAQTMLDSMNDWFDETVTDQLFPSS